MNDKKKSQGIKFLHIGDVHLDASYLGLPPEKSDERRHGLRDTFMRMMDYVRDGGIDYVLVSGDLFDTDYATNSTAELLIREFRNCSDTKFIIAPGRSDAYDDNPIYTSGRLPSNCHIFTEDKLSCIDFEEDNISVYGWAFRGESFYENPLYDAQAADTSKVNIVVGYADVDGEIGSDRCPVSTSDIKNFGAEYYAFGSRHEGGEFVNIGSAMYGYCGALESTGFDNPGIGGAKLITVKDDNGAISLEAKSMCFGQVVFKTETIDVSGVDTNNEIINVVSRLVSEKKYGAETALRLVMTGSLSPGFILPKNLGSDTFGLYHFEMIDKTLPLYGTEYLKRDMSVKGELFRQLLPMMESSDEAERLLGAQAFREGLAALEEREIET